MLVRASVCALVALGLALTPQAVYSQAQGQSSSQDSKGQDEKKPAGDKAKAGGQDQPAGDPHGGMSPEMMAEMQAAMAAMMPGPAHQKLAKLAGEWTAKTKLSMGSSMPPEEAEGQSRITVVMDGRFIHEEFSGTMHGMPFKSAKIMGFNNGSKKYEAVWTYTMGTNMMVMTGTSPDEGKTINCTATFDNEVGVKETLKVTYRMVDDDHFNVVLEAGKMPDGTPGPVMEMAYERKK